VRPAAPDPSPGAPANALYEVGRPALYLALCTAAATVFDQLINPNMGESGNAGLTTIA